MKSGAMARPSRVLIVDDRPENLLALEAVLEPLGVPIVRASSGDEALSELLRGEFAVVLLDVMMPDLDGLETAKLIKQRERSAHVPIIFITALGREAAYVFKGYQQGAVDYLLKPVDPDMLRAKVSAFLDLYKCSELTRVYASKLAESEERYRALLDTSSAAIYGVTSEGRCTFANSACVSLLGYETVGDLLGKDMHQLVHHTRLNGSPYPADHCALHLSCKNGTPARDDDDVFWRADGLPVPVEARSNPIVVSGTPDGAVVDVTDVRDRKTRLARLQLADRMASVATLAAGVAHEVNNPLAYVMANLDFASVELQSLRSRPGVADGPGIAQFSGVQQALADARQGAERVRIIIKGLKTFSRAQDAMHTALDLREILTLALKMAAGEVEQRARLTSEIGPLPSIAGNAAQLGQVFLNLIVNAGQAIEEGHPAENEVRVAARGDEKGVVIEISDTGAGISQETRNHIFEPFFTTKDPGEGTGLGLYICHGIVASHSGCLEVESEPGQGSVFRVRLPLGAAVAPGPVEASLEPGPAPRHGRLLVIDDEPMVRAAIQRVLSGDHDVVLVPSGRAALDLLEHDQRFDAILCDLLMPGMSGMDLHLELSHSRPALASKIIFLTGDASSKRTSDFFRTVPNAKIEKPFENAGLRRLLQAKVDSVQADGGMPVRPAH
jgi:PAS domain S-box-containing protein